MHTLLSPNFSTGLAAPRLDPLTELLRVPAPRELVDRTIETLRSLAHRPVRTGAPLSPSASGPGPQGDSAPAPLPEAALTMEELVRDHSDAVYRVALSVTRDPTLAEDASQDTLIKAWQALPSYRGDAPIRHWILRIAHNTSVSLLRRRREDVMSPHDFLDLTDAAPSVERQAQDRVAVERFEEALDGLDGISRSIVVLREIEGLSYNEMSDVLSLPLPTIRTRLLRARRQLATALDGWQP